MTYLGYNALSTQPLSSLGISITTIAGDSIRRWTARFRLRVWTAQ